MTPAEGEIAQRQEAESKWTVKETLSISQELNESEEIS